MVDMIKDFGSSCKVWTFSGALGMFLQLGKHLVISEGNAVETFITYLTLLNITNVILLQPCSLSPFKGTLPPFNPPTAAGEAQSLLEIQYEISLFLVKKIDGVPLKVSCAKLQLFHFTEQLNLIASVIRKMHEKRL